MTTKNKTTEIRYIGDSGAECREIGAETGAGDVLEHGATYTVSHELAETLTSTSAAFELVTPAKPKEANTDA